MEGAWGGGGRLGIKELRSSGVKDASPRLRDALTRAFARIFGWGGGCGEAWLRWMKHSIALKIFALALGIIGLTVVVAILTNIEVIGLGRDVATVARKTIPLASRAADLNEAGLFRRVAFERLYREYGEAQPD